MDEDGNLYLFIILSRWPIKRGSIARIYVQVAYPNALNALGSLVLPWEVTDKPSQ